MSNGKAKDGWVEIAWEQARAGIAFTQIVERKFLMKKVRPVMKQIFLSVEQGWRENKRISFGKK